MTSEMVERVAEALWQAESVRACGAARKTTWAEEGEDTHNKWRFMALSALKAIGEAPTAAMAMAGRIEQDCPCGRRHTLWAVNMWGAMLDAEIAKAEEG